MKTIIFLLFSICLSAQNFNNFAVRFNDANHNHINHGRFFNPGETYGSFFWEALVKPAGSGQYIISAGYGGAHCLLWGFDAPVNGECTISGNVFFDGTPTSFSTTEGVRVNQWCHVAIAGDSIGQKITLLINGVPSSVTQWTTGKRRTPAESDATLFVGGSDHQNFTGAISCIRGFEGVLPYANPHNVTVRPAVEQMAWTYLYNGTTGVSPSFLADYRTGLIKDWSLGLKGVKHDGFMVETISAGNAGLNTYNYLQNGNKIESKRPYFLVDKFSYTGSGPSETASGRIFDSFGRADQHKGNVPFFNLGMTQKGNKQWQNSYLYGILNGRVYPSQTSAPVTYIIDTCSSYEVRLYKMNSTPIPTGLGISYGLAFNIVDQDNYEVLVVDEYGTGYIQQFVGGAYLGHLGAISFGTTWNYMKVVVSGNQVQVFADGTLKATQTMTQNLSGRNKGMVLNHPLCRVEKFVVY